MKPHVLNYHLSCRQWIDLDKYWETGCKVLYPRYALGYSVLEDGFVCDFPTVNFFKDPGKGRFRDCQGVALECESDVLVGGFMWWGLSNFHGNFIDVLRIYALVRDQIVAWMPVDLDLSDGLRAGS